MARAKEGSVSECTYAARMRKEEEEQGPRKEMAAPKSPRRFPPRGPYIWTVLDSFIPAFTYVHTNRTRTRRASSYSTYLSSGSGSGSWSGSRSAPSGPATSSARSSGSTFGSTPSPARRRPRGTFACTATCSACCWGCSYRTGSGRSS